MTPLKWIVFIGCAWDVVLFHQTDYSIKYERIELVYYNKSFFKDFSVVLFHYTRYHKKVNLSTHLLQDLTSFDIRNTVQVYKFQSNEYRMFPVFVNSNACNLTKYNTYGTAVVSLTTNYVGCPLKKGFYYVFNGELDESKLPPYAPRGRFMFEIKTFYIKSLIATGKAYVEIIPTNPLEIIYA